MRDHPLTTDEFAIWYHMTIRARQMQTKEGRARIRTAAQAYALFGDDLSVTHDATLSSSSGAGATAGQETLAQRAWAETTTETTTQTTHDDEEGALAAVLRGGAIPPWMYARADLMLRALPPDDPRARYLRAGGKLDERGLPIIVEFDRARHTQTTRTVPTTADTTSTTTLLTPDDTAPPPPYTPASSTTDPTTDDDDDLDDATRAIWRQAQRHLPTLPPL